MDTHTHIDIPTPCGPHDDTGCNHHWVFYGKSGNVILATVRDVYVCDVCTGAALCEHIGMEGDGVCSIEFLPPVAKTKQELEYVRNQIKKNVN